MKYRYFSKETDDRGLLYYLDVGRVSDAEYDVLKPIIESLGGHWREREKAFVFGIDVEKEIKAVFENNLNVSQEWLNNWIEQHKTQFFPTPKPIAERVVELAGIRENQSVLEPSAGRGNLLDCLSVRCQIVAVEPLIENTEYLEKKGYNYCVSTFEDIYDALPCFDRVIMNPPFYGQRDIKHFLMAYNLLKDGGVIVGILSENALYYNTELTKNFNSFLKEHNAYIEPVPFHSFEESGTTIDTVIIKIMK